MELFEERNHFIIQNGQHALWCNRMDGSLTPKKGSDICSAWNPVCLGTILGVIGKIQILPDSEYRLLIVRQHSLVGSLPGGMEVYKISRVVVLPLSMEEPKELDLEMCRKHHFGISRIQRLAASSDGQQRALQKTWNSIKSVAETVKLKKRDNQKGKEKVERKILEEINRMFGDSDSFYYCPGDDLTNSVQRRNAALLRCHESGCHDDVAAWRRADDRFFWNQAMLRELIDSRDALADPWIVPVIQGYVQIEHFHLNLASSDPLRDGAMQTEDDEEVEGQRVSYKVCLVSRRSRHRAGTRYKRRGIDQDGHVANYVETEQIVEFAQHAVSFVQVRGSVPLYWSQPGIKYRPPPRIEKDEAENQTAFAAHFARQVALYRDVAVVSLVDLAGKEKVISDAFLHHAILLNSPRITYIAFDFHEYCRGMHFENIRLLTDSIQPLLKSIRYCWVDPNGMICEQRGVIRVNCIDCLDRTNIVQSVIARIVLETQCRKLGLLSPDQQLADNFRLVYQQMWADNGDAISKQYAGTAALKGDFTRTGERRFTGLMKDGVNSANRYYINRVKDAHRQATIDLLLGNPLPPELLTLAAGPGVGPNGPGVGDGGEGEGALVEKEENLRTLIDECKKMLVCRPEDCLGAWGLVDCDLEGRDPTQTDVDAILVLSSDAYYVASYDDTLDQVTSYLKVNLEDLVKIEIGTPVASLWRSRAVCLRIHYRGLGTTNATRFHTLRMTKTRLFNNMLVHVGSEEEATESLRAIAETLHAAKKLLGQPVIIVECKLERRRTGRHDGAVHIASEAQQQVTTLQRRDAAAARQGAPSSRFGATLAGAVRSRLALWRPAARLLPTVWYRNNAVAIAAPPGEETDGGSGGPMPRGEATATVVSGELILLESCGLIAVGGARPHLPAADSAGPAPGSASTRCRRTLSCDGGGARTDDASWRDDVDATTTTTAAATREARSDDETPSPLEASSTLLHMKTSFSEGSLGTLVTTAQTDGELPTVAPSALARLRRRLPGQSGGRSAVVDRVLEETVARNRLRSELRFRECKTRVMLL